MGMPMRPHRASEYTHGWWVPASASFQESLLCMPMGTTMWEDRQMTWRCTSTDQDGFNERASTHGWWIPASASFQESLLCPWARRCGWISKWHDDAHLQAKTVPMNLIWSESATCLPSSSVRTMNLIWSESAPCLPSSSVRKVPGMFIMCGHTQIHRPRQSQWTWFGVNLPGVLVSTRFQEPF